MWCERAGPWGLFVCVNRSIINCTYGKNREGRGSASTLAMKQVLCFHKEAAADAANEERVLKVCAMGRYMCCGCVCID